MDYGTDKNFISLLVKMMLSLKVVQYFYSLRKIFFFCSVSLTVSKRKCCLFATKLFEEAYIFISFYE